MSEFFLKRPKQSKLKPHNPNQNAQAFDKLIDGIVVERWRGKEEFGE